MGPNTNDRGVMKSLFENGMNIARFNFSHGDHEEQKGRMDMIKELRKETGKEVAILLDTKGPEIRTGVLVDDKKVTLVEGNEFVLTTEDIQGTDAKVMITYAGLVEDLKAGNRILIDDGLIELEVKSIAGNEITTVILNGGELGSRKGVNVPGVPVKLPALTDKDKSDILFGSDQEVDFIAASFVRNAAGVQEIIDLLKDNGRKHIPIIAKIENQEGVDNLDEIIALADGIMVARGDLGVEVPEEEVPFLQKMMIKKCNEAFKPVITATQMLDSMMRNPRPTRAEVTDVANAVYDGTDAIMLSGETAQGKYPIEAVSMMSRIAAKTENDIDNDMLRERVKTTGEASVSIAAAAVTTSMNVETACVVTKTVSGATSRVVSKFRPEVTIVGLTPSEEVMRNMQIFRGVEPVLAPANITDEEAIALAASKGFAKAGETVVLTSGIQSAAGATSMMQVATVK